MLYVLYTYKYTELDVLKKVPQVLTLIMMSLSNNKTKRLVL